MQVFKPICYHTCDLMISSSMENMTLQENSSALRVWVTLSVYCQGIQYGKGPCAACSTTSLGGYS